jgi:hypothetical protein
MNTDAPSAGRRRDIRHDRERGIVSKEKKLGLSALAILAAAIAAKIGHYAESIRVRHRIQMIACLIWIHAKRQQPAVRTAGLA